MRTGSQELEGRRQKGWSQYTPFTPPAPPVLNTRTYLESKMPVFTEIQADAQVPLRRTAGKTGSPGGHNIRPESPPTARPCPMCRRHEIAAVGPLKSPSQHNYSENPRPAGRKSAVFIEKSMKIPETGKNSPIRTVCLRQFTLLNFGGMYC